MGETPRNTEELEEQLSRPTPGVLKTLARIPGDLLILGAAGKMGPTLARMARRGWDQLGSKQKVIAVARFSNPDVERALHTAGVETLHCDLLDRTAVQRLPDCPNLVFMAGQKFGTSEAPELTWAMNAVAPALVAERFPGARTVVFSTGCVYPNVAISSGGSLESDALEPVGEYANSCVARERIFSYFAGCSRTPLAIFRLNYAIDLRYGVLVDIALKVMAGDPINLSMGYVNVIWQGDANARALQLLENAACPPFVLNVTGPETVPVRKLAGRFGELLGREPILEGEESSTALLSNAARAQELFGDPTVSLQVMIQWVAEWVGRGGPTLNKPTHFETRDGRY